MYRLRTLGGLSLERDGVTHESIGGQRKALALLACLAAAGEAGMSRDRLMALLWPESDTRQARAALKQLLYVIRRELGADVVTGVAELRMADTRVDADVRVFVRACEAEDPAAAAAVYAGAFLDGVHVAAGSEFEQWADARRDALARLYADVLERLARAAANAGDEAGAVEFWRRLHLQDPLSSRVTLELMRALDANGDRAAALRLARMHQALLQDELGTDGDPAVAALASLLTTTPPKAGGNRRGSTASAAADAPSDTHATDPAAEQAEGNATRGSHATGSRRRALAAVGAATILLAVAAFAAWRDAAAGTDLDARRVAVVTFENRTGDTRLDAIGGMAADWIARGVMLTASLDVVEVGGQGGGRNAPDARALARESGAGLVVHGSYYRSNDSIRLSASIGDVRSGRTLHVVESAGAPADAAAGIIEEMRSRVATAVAAVVHPQRSSFTPVPAQPPLIAAFEEFVAGQDLYWRGAFDAALPHFARAAALDTAFAPARRWVTLAAVGIGRCDVVDSMHASLGDRADAVSNAERLALRAYDARCRNDWDEVLRLGPARTAGGARSPQATWGTAAALRRARRPGDALARLREIDPARDLGWITDPAKVLYWREVAAAHHALGDFAGERAAARRIGRAEPNRLAASYAEARSLAGAGNARGALAVLDEVMRQPPDPSMVAGEVAWGRSAEALGTPGWVLYQIATELRAHGHPREAAVAAERAAGWFAARPAAEAHAIEHRLTHAEALAFVGRPREALHVLAPLLSTHANDVDVRGMAGALAALLGDTAAAAAADAWLEQVPSRHARGLPVLHRARIAAASGAGERALTLLETLPYGAHPADPLMFHSDPFFDRLLRNDRFARIIASRDRRR